MEAIIIVIKRLRKFKGFTQEVMAEKLHLSLRAYQKIESGHTKLDIDRLNQFAKILEISLPDLINAKVSTEQYLADFDNGSRDNMSSLRKLIYEKVNRLLHTIIEAKEGEISYLNTAFVGDTT